MGQSQQVASPLGETLAPVQPLYTRFLASDYLPGASELSHHSNTKCPRDNLEWLLP